MPHIFADPATLQTLLMQIADGNAHALTVLYLRTKPRLASYALRMVHCENAAQDVLQETVLAIWRDAHRYNESLAAPMTWMMTVVRNKSIDFLRAQGRIQRVFGPDFESEDAIILGGPDLMMEELQVRQMLGDGLSKIDPLHRQALELAYFDDLSHSEVAQKMMIPLGTAKTWIRRGCISLRSNYRLRPKP